MKNLIRLLVPLLALIAVPAFAVTRTLDLTAPTVVKAGMSARVTINAATDATDGELIGFFHAEYSTDSGKTWTPVYLEKPGQKVERVLDLKAGAEGTKTLVRVRVAYRGGKAGDVDFNGKAIGWDTSWGKWENPPAKNISISVTR